MPFAVQKQGHTFVVVKKSTGEVLGHHPSKEKAQAQIAAIYASETRAKKQ